MVLGQETITEARSHAQSVARRTGQLKNLPRVDHVDTVFECDSDNVILGEISSYRGQTLANLVSLVGLRIRTKVSMWALQ